MRLRWCGCRRSSIGGACTFTAITDTDLSFSPDEVFELAKGAGIRDCAGPSRSRAATPPQTWFRAARVHADHRAASACGLIGIGERVEQRLELIESDRFVNLLERPEYKRRWNWESWEDLAHDALREWLLTRLEDPRYWPSIGAEVGRAAR